MQTQAQVVRFSDFRQPQNTTIAEARRGRFMIMPDIDALDDRLDDLPDDVIAFAFRRMVREFRLGRALDDGEAAYKLHKHARTIARLRRQHGEFLAQMDGASGHARRKFLTRKSGKSSNFRGSRPQQNCQSAPPESDPTGIEPVQVQVLSPVGVQKAPDAAPCCEASTAPAQEEQGEELRTFLETPNPGEQPDHGPPERTPEEIATISALTAQAIAKLTAYSRPAPTPRPAIVAVESWLDRRIDEEIAAGRTTPQPAGWNEKTPEEIAEEARYWREWAAAEAAASASNVVGLSPRAEERAAE